jgi:hypothetical protein
MANNTWKRKLEQDPSVYIKKLKLEPKKTLLTIEESGDDIPRPPDLFQPQNYTVQLPSDSDDDLEDDIYHTQDPHSHPSALNPIENTSSQMYKVVPPFSHLLYSKPTSLPVHLDTITPENNPYALIPYIDRRIQPFPSTTLEVTISDHYHNANNDESSEEEYADGDDDTEPMEIE